MGSKVSRGLVLISLAVLIASLSITKIADYDLWWHLARGEYSLKTWDITAADTFSYTFRGMPQYNGEWLADALLYIFYGAGGLVGLNILKASVLILTFFFLHKAVKNTHGEDDSYFYASILTLVVVAFSIRFRLYIRPFLFSYLFLAVFFWLISSYSKTKDVRFLYLLPVIEVIWANMSKAAFYGPLVLLLFLTGEFFARRLTVKHALIFIITFILSTANPETYGAYSMPFKITALDTDFFVGEHQPLSVELLWGHGLKYTLYYQALAVGAAAYFVLFGGWMSIYHIALFLFFFIPSVRMIRMIDFFSLAAALMFVRPLEALIRPFVGLFSAKRAVLNLALAAAIFIAAVSAAFSKTYSFGVGVKEDGFPEEALKFLDEKKITGTLFNSYPFGSYIIFKSPERKVFIDGRGVHYLYTAGFFREYLEIVKDPSQWSLAEKRWGFEAALVEYDIKEGGRHFPLHLNDNPDWALVWWDNHSAVYLKKTEGNRKVIEDYGYRVSRPALYDFSYLERYLRTGLALEAARAIDRDISLNPKNQEPRLAKAYLLYNLKDPLFKDEALKEIKISLGLKPDIPMEHTAAAMILFEKGFKTEAKKELETALSIDPFDEGANLLRKRFEKN